MFILKNKEFGNQKLYKDSIYRFIGDINEIDDRSRSKNSN